MMKDLTNCSALDWAISWGFASLSLIFLAFCLLILVNRTLEKRYIDRVSLTAIAWILIEVGVLYFRGNYVVDGDSLSAFVHCGDPVFRFISFIGHAIMLGVLSWDTGKPIWAISLLIASCAMMLSYLWVTG